MKDQWQHQSGGADERPVRTMPMARPVATPMRQEEVDGWSPSSSRYLCGEGEEAVFASRVRLLDRNVVSSVRDAAERLNRRLIWCAEDCCVVFSAQERSYYLLSKAGREDAALARLGLSREQQPRASIAVARESGPGTDVARLSLPDAKVVRQSSVPTWPGGGAQGKPPRLVATPAAAASGGALTTQGGPAIPQAGTPGVPPATTSSYAPPAHSGYRHTSPAPRRATSGSRQEQQNPHWAPATPPLAAQVPVATAWEAQRASPPHPLPPPHLQLQMQQQSSYAPAGGSCHQAPGPPQPAPQTPQPQPQQPQSQAQQKVTRWQLQVPMEQQKQLPTPEVALPIPAAPRPSTAETSNEAFALRCSTTPREDPLMRGTMLSDGEMVKYQELQFVESLGSGEFGQVFRGFFRNQQVAIKQLYWDDTLSAMVMQDLAKEIQGFRHLRHRRLVCFIGACLEMPHPCLVTEYMPGGSLHHLLHVRKQQLPHLHAQNMCCQVSDGVMYLHDQTPTVVHRDLKSLNVVLDLGLNIKICDFGLTEPMERTHITKKNNGGSPRYMAPELFDAKTKITEKIDVWAMGCIFIEIFGGPLPYEQINSLGELTKELLVHRRAPTIPEFLPIEVRHVARSMLDFDHTVRPSARETYNWMKSIQKQLKENRA